ncbi:hypothetical protein TcCL_Unassigned02392 [Trypanosoma cruzi]|nr:hypothetical protein TcCL_Unassigned02392 [Trypanosoma cruzi]
MNGCRQDALTIKMAREHAATPRRNTGKEGERGKSKKQHNTHGRNKLQARKAPPRPSPWPATPHQPTHTHHRSAVSPQVRGFGPPHNKRIHRQQSPTNGRGREETHRHRLQFNPTANKIRPQPRSQHTKHTEQAITQRATRGSGSSSSHDAAPHSTRSHRAHWFLNRNYPSSIP